MINTLPPTLKEVEDSISRIIIANITSFTSNKLAINLRFEGLRIMPIGLRLARTLLNSNINAHLLWSDAGSVALAKRDAPALINNIHSFSDVIKNKYQPKGSELLIAISPQPYDYEEFEVVSSTHKGKLIMFNGRLEDTAVGIGSIGRERRRDFISDWDYIYYLEPMKQAALMSIYPYGWSLFKEYEDGYRFIESFDQRPDSDLISDKLYNR